MHKIPFIERGTVGSMDFQQRRTRYSQLWLGVYVIGIFLFLIVAIFRLFHLTVLRGAYFSLLADSNRTRETIIEPRRGDIRDRKGIILATSSPADEASDAARLTAPRVYSDAEAQSHIVGYRQPADRADFSTDPCLNKLEFGDKTGKKGVERLMECQLRGQNGKKLIEVDAHGKYVRTISVEHPTQGSSVTLALDSYLQLIAYEQMRGKKGAIVAVKPQTGELLIFLSSPSYDIQQFEYGNTLRIQSILSDPNKPLFDRAAEGVYPPGSTFKIFVAAAGLEEKVIKKDTIVEDKGFIQAGPLTFHNWYYLEYGKTEGDVDLVKSIQRSNDIYYYKLGALLGPDKIRKWGEMFGLHTKSGFGLEESDGVLPGPFWKEDVLHEKWYLGDTYNLAIGQGYVTASPLQIAMGTAAFANGGSYCKPMLLKSGTEFAQPVSCTRLPMSSTTYGIVREGMHKACSDGGTGWPFFDFSVPEATVAAKMYEASESAKLFPRKKIEVGCKTGTAESHAQSGKPHAWFTVFAPFDNPEIALTVLVEEGGQGSDVAAPIAKEILTRYFSRSE